MSPLPVRPRHIAVEGPMGVGKTAVAQKLAPLIGARALLEPVEDNPFLDDFHHDRAKYAFQAQVFFLLSRQQLLAGIAQQDLFSGGTVTDFLFERERVFAALTLDSDELGLYDRIHAVVRDRVPRPDLVVYLQARPDVLLDRLRARPAGSHRPALRELDELTRIYNDFFFHYEATPLLVVNASDVDFAADDEEMRYLAQEVLRCRGGAQHYNPTRRA